MDQKSKMASSARQKRKQDHMGKFSLFSEATEQFEILLAALFLG
jgi:hypothetical protein